MESRHLLSPAEYNWITSQNVVLSNKSETLKRIRDKLRQSLTTFNYVLRSDKFEQEYLDDIFSVTTIHEVLRNLIRYDPTKIPSENNNKLALATSMIKLGIDYYQSRFKETKFFAQRIKDIDSLLTDMNNLVQSNLRDEKNQKLYSMRTKWRYPPNIKDYGSDSEWRAMCVICWNYSGGKTLKEAVQNIRHHIYCDCDKRDLDICIKSYPPRTP